VILDMTKIKDGSMELTNPGDQAPSVDSQTRGAVKGEKSRLLYIDNIRVLLTVLVVLHHMAITYGGPGGWYYHEFTQSPLDLATTLVLTFFVAINQTFFMGLFFFIAGYFTPLSYDRKGSGAFLKDRFLRLGVPILFYMAVLAPVLQYFLAVARGNIALSSGKFFSFYLAGILDLEIGPLWFVETLLFFALGYVLYRALAGGRGARIQKAPGLPDRRTIVLFALAVGLASFLMRIWSPIGMAFPVVNLQFAFFLQYLCMFILGVVAFRSNWLDQVSPAMAKPWLIITVGLIGFLPILYVLVAGPQGDTSAALGGLHWQALLYAVWEQLVGAGMAISLLYIFREKFNRQGSLAAAMSASAYTVFIIHALVVVGVALLFRGYPMHPLLKFFLLAPLAVVVCFVIASRIRKLPLARDIL
jgi:glucan biosynthesis protein C